MLPYSLVEVCIYSSNRLFTPTIESFGIKPLYEWYISTDKNFKIICHRILILIYLNPKAQLIHYYLFTYLYLC